MADWRARGYHWAVVRRTRGTGGRGFTLVELMVAVAIVGVLAAIAVPAFQRYARKAKTAEATTNLRKIVEGARVSIHDTDTLVGRGYSSSPGGPVGPEDTHAPMTPSLGTCCAMGGQCVPQAELWASPYWQLVKFELVEPHYYMYAYDIVGDAFTARAMGDLDCDGNYATFEMYAIEGDRGETHAGAGLYAHDELE
ncbi:MAG: pilin [Deltaproteobacteria bacterium]|nr:MAG: pilin [Deltaproteobacteria bacterium]